MTYYPVPRYASSAWIAGDSLWLSFPPMAVGEQGHSVPYPIDLAALRALSAKHPALRGVVLALDTLATRHAKSAIGTKGSPVSDDIRKAASNNERYKAWLRHLDMTRQEVAEGDKELKELGL